MSELASQINAMASAISDFKQDINERVSELEIAKNRPSNPNSGRSTPEDREHLEAFLQLARSPKDMEAMARLQAAQKSIRSEVKTTVDGDGGYAVPEQIATAIEKQLRELNPLRQFARVDQVASSDFKVLVDVNGTTSGWVGETGTRNETDSPGLEEVAPTFGTVYAYPKFTEESAMDIFFNVQNWLQESAAEEFAIEEGAAFVDGNGSNKPTGFLDGTPESAGDNDSPPRAFGTLQYVATGVSDGFGHDPNGSPEVYGGDVLIDTIYALKPRYRTGPNVAWLMNNSTAQVIRKWKNKDGDYVWQSSMQAGEPDRLMGYPVVINDAMPDIGADAFPVAFGNWRKGYEIADQAGLRITVDPYTTPGYTKLYIRKRVGGKVLDSNAIKLVKCATS